MQTSIKRNKPYDFINIDKLDFNTPPLSTASNFVSISDDIFTAPNSTKKWTDIPVLIRGSIARWLNGEISFSFMLYLIDYPNRSKYADIIKTLRKKYGIKFVIEYEITVENGICENFYDINDLILFLNDDKPIDKKTFRETVISIQQYCYMVERGLIVDKHSDRDYSIWLNGHEYKERNFNNILKYYHISFILLNNFLKWDNMGISFNRSFSVVVDSKTINDYANESERIDLEIMQERRIQRVKEIASKYNKKYLEELKNYGNKD